MAQVDIRRSGSSSYMLCTSKEKHLKEVQTAIQIEVINQGKTTLKHKLTPILQLERQSIPAHPPLSQDTHM